MLTTLAEARALIGTILATAQQRKRAVPPPPPEPDPGICCGRGCERCVFVAYYEALRAWRQQALYTIFNLA
jgi:hypothetical protein